MRVIANLSICQGHGRCMETCPEVFTTDDRLGKVVVLTDPVPADLEEKVRDAIDNCPEGAITLDGERRGE